MIEINLLPHREARRIADLRQTIAVLVLGLVLVGAGVMFTHQGITNDLDQARTQVQQLEAAIEQFKPQQAQVASFKKKRSELESKLDVIQGLENARTGPVRMFDELSKLVPERLWLSNLTTKGKNLMLSGSSIDTGVVADFLRALNQSKYFNNVDLESTSASREVEGVKLVTFKVKADFKNADVEAKAKKKKSKNAKKKG